MSDYLANKLDGEQLERLAFEQHDDYWSDIDGEVLVYELINGSGYQQFVFDDDHHQKFSFGIPLKAVIDLMQRYKSVTGHDARYYTGDLPINAQ